MGEQERAAEDSGAWPQRGGEHERSGERHHAPDHGGARRSRGDAGNTRGCGCLSAWGCMGLIVSLMLAFLVGTTVPVSTIAGPGGVCGEKTVVECVSDSVSVLERLTEVYENPEGLFDVESDNPFEDVQQP